MAPWASRKTSVSAAQGPSGRAGWAGGSGRMRRERRRSCRARDDVDDEGVVLGANAGHHPLGEAPKARPPRGDVRIRRRAWPCVKRRAVDVQRGEPVEAEVRCGLPRSCSFLSIPVPAALASSADLTAAGSPTRKACAVDDAARPSCPSAPSDEVEAVVGLVGERLAARRSSRTTAARWSWRPTTMFCRVIAVAHVLERSGRRRTSGR